MNATLQALEASGAALEIETIEIGEKVYLRGDRAGIDPNSWESLLRTKVFLKAPITTPQGGGFKSLNVTIRKALGLYANVRPCVSYHPFIDARNPNMDVVIVRENEEDLYAGIECRLSPEVTSCLKLISRPGSEKIVRYAFEYARRYNRRKVAAFMKDNIMKMTDGLFHKVFDEIAAQYPEIQNEAWFVDAGAAKMADAPEAFDVIVMPNLYGDILSDVAAQMAGSVGLAGSANVGDKCAMFEAVQGSAPRRGGQNLANPSGLLLGAVLMLVHIGQAEAAERLHNAWLRTMEDGIHTYDVFTEGVSAAKVGTKEFARAVVERLGRKPNRLKAVSYARNAAPAAEAPAVSQVAPVDVKLKGMDVFVCWPSRNPNELASAMGKCAGEGLALQMIDNRGVEVWPAGLGETFCTDSFRCRFLAEGRAEMPRLLALLQRISEGGIGIAMTQTLRTFDGQAGFSLAQGQ